MTRSHKPVVRAIDVAHAAYKDEFRRNRRSRSGIFSLYIITDASRTSRRVRIHIFTPPNNCKFVCVIFVLLSVIALPTLPYCIAIYEYELSLCRGFVTTELVHLRGRIGTDTGGAGCRRVE